jgi:hypothetical protein
VGRTHAAGSRTPMLLRGAPLLSPLCFPHFEWRLVALASFFSEELLSPAKENA